MNEEVDPSRLASDWDVLVSFLRERIDEIGDVDGVLGFSQGASLAAWMCSERVREVREQDVVSGFVFLRRRLMRV